MPRHRWLLMLALLVLVPLTAFGQRGDPFGFGRSRFGVNPNVRYDGRFNMVRIRYLGNRLVNDGQGMDEVLYRCGEPSYRDYATEYVSFETPTGLIITKEVPIETWTYNFGPRMFVRYLKFRGGRLVRVAEGDYGD